MKPEASTNTQIEISAQPVRIEPDQNSTILPDTFSFLLLPLMLIAFLFLVDWCIQVGEFWHRKERNRRIIIQLQQIIALERSLHIESENQRHEGG
ncbi:MAG: hypothetical protein HC769_03580 [Cyanobacteria bacterium CRU_2_1]|nr:hypothetical protein [Cyanobacteria bacterium RU_5_0]NJR58005.1 hypothetical protein [Cyanobacteria bacterium CRU_2_1]